MRCFVWVILVLTISLPASAQGQKAAPSAMAVLEEYLGVWSAFSEGTAPNKDEEPSKLIVFKDVSNRIVVFLAYRFADRQIHFIYGFAKMERGALRFVDQMGLPYVLSFGDSVDHGRFLTIAWDNPASESDYGEYLRVSMK